MTDPYLSFWPCRCCYLAEEDGVADVLRDLGVDVPEHGHPPRVLVRLARRVAAAGGLSGGGVASVAAGAQQDGGEHLGRRLRTLSGGVSIRLEIAQKLAQITVPK